MSTPKAFLTSSRKSKPTHMEQTPNQQSIQSISSKQTHTSKLLSCPESSYLIARGELKQRKTFVGLSLPTVMMWITKSRCRRTSYMNCSSAATKNNSLISPTNKNEGPIVLLLFLSISPGLLHCCAYLAR